MQKAQDQSLVLRPPLRLLRFLAAENFFAGRLSTRTLANGVTTQYQYNTMSRLVQTTVTTSTGTLWAQRYGFNPAGKRVYTLAGTTGTIGDAYNLDATGQLTGVKYGATGADAGYASATNPTSTATWTYDETGNRITQVEGASTTTYTSNAVNQYTAVTGAGTLAYSSRGDLTQHGDWSYVYDAGGNLIRAHNTQSNLLAKYWRDAAGHRAVKDIDGAKTLYFNFGFWPMEAYDLTAETSRSTIYEPGIDRPLCEINDDGTIRFFYHQDWLGNVAMLTDAAGGKLQTYAYDVWGEPSGFDSSGNPIAASAYESRFLFTAREYDSETGLYNYRARAYSPAMGRFAQFDPIDFAGGDVNLLRYASNNPINWVDPLGLITIVMPGLGPQNSGSNGDFVNRVSNMHSDAQQFGRHQQDQQRALDAIKDALAKDPCEEVNIYGYSRGGVGALELAEKLNQARIPVDNLILVDPVTVTGNGGGLDVPSNVRNAESHYQGSLRQGPLDFPGTPLNNPGPGRSNTPYSGPHQNMPGQFQR